MLSKMIPIDDIPLTLGKKVEPVAAKAPVPVDIGLGVKWVSDERAPMSDMAHPLAEMASPGATFDDGVRKLIEAFWNQNFPAVPAESQQDYRPKTATEINMRMRAAMERMTFAPPRPECGVTEGGKHFLHCRR